tara:strand:- start:1382 stop:1675 length:294 start_codon:yes stop_codon:yes gene_type:complete
MKALIFENKIVDVSEQEFDVNESLTWIDCPDACVVGRWELVDGVPTAPEPVQPLTYDVKRYNEYILLNQYELMYDDKVNSTNKWGEAIEAIKTKFPK